MLCQYLLQDRSVLPASMVLVAVWMSVSPQSLPEQGDLSGCRGRMKASKPLLCTQAHCPIVGRGGRGEASPSPSLRYSGATLTTVMP